MTYLAGVGLVVAFCVYAISRIWSLRTEEDRSVKIKAMVFYLFLIGMAILFFMITTMSATPLDFNQE
jgi:hypothetical protein